MVLTVITSPHAHHSREIRAQVRRKVVLDLHIRTVRHGCNPGLVWKVVVLCSTENPASHVTLRMEISKRNTGKADFSLRV